MFKTRLLILCVVFFVTGVNAQAPADSFPLLSQLSSFKLISIGQAENSLPANSSKQLTLFVFLSPECPLCQNYSTTFRQLSRQFNGQVDLYGIVPGKSYTKDEVLSFENKYKTGLKLFMDEDQQLTHYLKATTTPQAILLDSKGVLLYTGAIDDWIKAQGKKKINATQFYLRDAIEQSLQHAPVKISKTKAIGCKINDY